MDEKTRDALNEAIDKRQTFVENGGKFDGTLCPLCAMFSDCVGCPVYEFTGCEDCNSTPFWEWVLAKTEEDALKAAKEELEFLKSLQ